MKNYNTTVIVGAQWGDEGKGKMTDVFANNSDIIVRFSGGDNAGHLIKFNQNKYKVTIIPSGIFNKNSINIIGNGCVINLPNLVREWKTIVDTKEEIGKLLISDRAHLILPYHIEIDSANEDMRGKNKIGTTKRGVGPTYTDKAARIGLRICDIGLPNFKEKLAATLEYHNKILINIHHKEPFKLEEVYSQLYEAYEQIKDKIIDCGSFLEAEIKKGKKVLFEGAQGALLDIDHGTYPFVTSSNCSANNVPIGAGVSSRWINEVIGVVKAYSTRVGTGAMPTEIFDDVSDQIRTVGHEFGTNSGKPRRIGWIDLVALKHSIRTSGLDKIFITLLDVLTNLKTLKLCVKYEFDGKEIDYIPASNEEFEKCKPVFIEMEGWDVDITKVTSRDQLPENAIKYLDKIQEVCDIEVLGFSVGPDRKQTVFYK